MEKIGNRYLLRADSVHLGPEQIQLALHKGHSAAKQRAGKQRIELSMAVTAIYPEAKLVDADPKLIGVKRAWLNIFGFRPDLGCLANNSTGDTCQFCMHCYADQAYYTPPLFDDFTALDLVRISLDRYFDGFKGYRDDFQDVAPSTIIAAWDYATGKPDPAWLKRRIGAIEKYAERMIAMDVDGDGLCESQKRPEQLVGLHQLELERRLQLRLGLAGLPVHGGPGTSSGRSRRRRSGIGSGRRRSKLSITGLSIIPKPACWRVGAPRMARLATVISSSPTASPSPTGWWTSRRPTRSWTDSRPRSRKSVSTTFSMAFPETSWRSRTAWSFQLYENGGATGSMAYYYVQALYAAGRKAEAEAIFGKMLEGYRDGTFQNGIGNGGDWKEWNGTPCGYEGLLVDAFYPLTALITGRLGRGVPLP